MPTVLVLEDEEVLRSSMVRGIVKLPGIETVEAGTFSEAVRFLDSNPPDLVLSDIDLPDRSGIEILGELGKRGIRSPVVFISAYLKAYSPQIPKHANVEVRDKPISLEELRQLVVSKIGQSESKDDEPPFSVADYIQIACLGRHSVVIEVYGKKNYSGIIQIYNGDIWHVRDVRGADEDTFRRVLFAKAETVKCHTLRESPDERNIFQNWQQLLMETARIEDENNRDGNISDDFGEEEENSVDVSKTEGFTDASQENNILSDGFDELWEEAVNALLLKDNKTALRIFLQAEELRPENNMVKANIKRLSEMGINLENNE